MLRLQKLKSAHAVAATSPVAATVSAAVKVATPSCGICMDDLPRASLQSGLCGDACSENWACRSW
jgi:hypothetical protein